jgi:hypothetical protein
MTGYLIGILTPMTKQGEGWDLGERSTVDAARLCLACSKGETLQGKQGIYRQVRSTPNAHVSYRAYGDHGDSANTMSRDPGPSGRYGDPSAGSRRAYRERSGT